MLATTMIAASGSGNLIFAIAVAVLALLSFGLSGALTWASSKVTRTTAVNIALALAVAAVIVLLLIEPQFLSAFYIEDRDCWFIWFC